jgi:flagellar FliL protein
MAEVQAAAQAPDAPKKLLQEKPRKTGYVTSVLLLVALGGGVWWTFFRGRSSTSASQSISSPIRTVLPLESFTVNLADDQDGHFLRATLALGVDGQLPPMGKSESKAPESSSVSMATIRDSILSVLTQSKSADLLTPEGKAKLKRDIIDALNRDVSPPEAREVYFVEFLVQR